MATSTLTQLLNYVPTLSNMLHFSGSLQSMNYLGAFCQTNTAAPWYCWLRRAGILQHRSNQSCTLHFQPHAGSLDVAPKEARHGLVADMGDTGLATPASPDATPDISNSRPSLAQPQLPGWLVGWFAFMHYLWYYLKDIISVITPTRWFLLTLLV